MNLRVQSTRDLYKVLGPRNVPRSYCFTADVAGENHSFHRTAIAPNHGRGFTTIKAARWKLANHSALEQDDDSENRGSCSLPHVRGTIT